LSYGHKNYSNIFSISLPNFSIFLEAFLDSSLNALPNRLAARSARRSARIISFSSSGLPIVANQSETRLKMESSPARSNAVELAAAQVLFMPESMPKEHAPKITNKRPNTAASFFIHPLLPFIVEKILTPWTQIAKEAFYRAPSLHKKF